MPRGKRIPPHIKQLIAELEAHKAELLETVDALTAAIKLLKGQDR